MRRLAPVAFLFVLFVPCAGAWTWPVSGPVLERFSFDPAHPYGAGQHRGIAIGADAGAPVVAPATGIVTFAGTVAANGRIVTIETPAGLAVSLTHLGSIAVAKSDQVAEGAVVGTVGPSGTAEFPVPYVHVGIRTAADPQGYLDPLAFLPVAAAPIVEPPPPAPTVEVPVAPPVEPASPAAPPAATPLPAAPPVEAPTPQVERPAVPAAPQVPVAAPALSLPAARAVAPEPVVEPAAPPFEVVLRPGAVTHGRHSLVPTWLAPAGEAPSLAVGTPSAQAPASRRGPQSVDRHSPTAIPVAAQAASSPAVPSRPAPVELPAAAARPPALAPVLAAAGAALAAALVLLRRLRRRRPGAAVVPLRVVPPLPADGGRIAA